MGCRGLEHQLVVCLSVSRVWGWDDAYYARMCVCVCVFVCICACLYVVRGVCIKLLQKICFFCYFILSFQAHAQGDYLVVTWHLEGDLAKAANTWILSG